LRQVTCDLLFEAVAGKWLSAGEALVHDARQGVDVGAMVGLSGG
jgi:hypothetical protein